VNGPTLTAEIDPASDYCQRWSDRSHSWTHRSAGGFDPARYDVAELDEVTAKAYVVRHHYSGTYPAASRRSGLLEAGEIVGVAVLSTPAGPRVLTAAFPELRPSVESLELGRLVLADRVPANAESWLLGQVFRMAAEAGVRGVVSFADPVPRVIEGRVVMPGHVGTIYQATNAVYTGRGDGRTILIARDGTVLNNRALGKVRRQEVGSEYVERHLVTLGARPRRAGEPAAAWLEDALEAVIVQRLRHRGNHRYCFALGNRRERRDVRVGFARTAYPKSVDRAAT
jgi:hypothetical protein